MFCYALVCQYITYIHILMYHKIGYSIQTNDCLRYSYEFFNITFTFVCVLVQYCFRGNNVAIPETYQII